MVKNRRKILKNPITVKKKFGKNFQKIVELSLAQNFLECGVWSVGRSLFYQFLPGFLAPLGLVKNVNSHVNLP